MVIYDFNVMRIALTPGKADAPSVVDSNAVRPRTVAFQQLQLVPRRHAKILQPQCPMQVQKLPPRRPFDGLESPNPAVLKERRGVWALERSDQVSVYYVASVMSNVMPGKAALAGRWRRRRQHPPHRPPNRNRIGRACFRLPLAEPKEAGYACCSDAADSETRLRQPLWRRRPGRGEMRVIDNRSAARPVDCFRVSDLEKVL